MENVEKENAERKSRKGKRRKEKCKAIDTLEDPGSSILSYRSQVTRGVFYYVPKKKSYFLVALTKIPNFNPFLSNISLVNEFILLIPRSYNRKETNNILVQKNENNR